MKAGIIGAGCNVRRLFNENYRGTQSLLDKREELPDNERRLLNDLGQREPKLCLG